MHPANLGPSFLLHSNQTASTAAGMQRIIPPRKAFVMSHSQKANANGPAHILQDTPNTELQSLNNPAGITSKIKFATIAPH